MKPSQSKKQTRINRRDLIKTGGMAALGVLAAGSGHASPAKQSLDPRDVQKSAATRLSPEAKTVHSVCLACNARCGVRGVVKEGKLVNISGNPYHPYNTQFSPIDYDTEVKTALKEASPICGKALDTPNHIYSPYRLRKPLKRSGPRGSGKFEPVSWNDLIREIGQGGKLFAHLGEDRIVPGIRDLLSDEPIDPVDPCLGNHRNGLVFLTGRLQSGRKEFIDRFVKSAVGSRNRIGHTDICGLGFRMGNFALSGGTQVELKADPKNADYILLFGANIYEALQPGVNTYGAMVARRQADGPLSFSIVDPRATRAAAHAQDWLAVKPGKDGALAMGIIRWMIENNVVNREYLSTPNEKQIKKKGFGVLSNASHLVICDPGHPDNGAFLRMKHLDPSLNDTPGQEKVVFSVNGKVPRPAASIGTADLDRQATVTDYFGNAIQVKTAFALLKQEAMAHPLSEYAAQCGVGEGQIASVAREFSSHGTRAAVTQYHGAGNYVNGTYAAYAIAALNALVGSVNMKGGYLKGGGGCGKPTAGLFDLKSFPGKKKNGGVAISREKAHYEKSAEFAQKKAKTGSGYPAERPWFSFTKGGLSVEALSGIDQQYPYKAQVLFTYLFNPVYSIPGGYRFKETLADPDKVPLYVSIDTAVNESNVYSDYIIPDLSFAEGHYGWLTPHAPGLSFTGIRSPMIEPLTDKTPDGRPICTETLLIDLAVSLGLPGFGKKAIPGADNTLHDLMCAEDFYVRAFANIAHGAKLPHASDEEVQYVESKGLLLDDLESGFPFSVVTYKNRLHTQSRSLWSQHSMEIQGENRVEMNEADVRRLGLTDEDTVIVASPSNPAGIRGKVRSTALIRPGCVAVSFHFGHTQFGAGPLDIPGGESAFMGGQSIIKGRSLVTNPLFAKGLNFNDVALLETHLNRTPMVDLVGGIPDFSSTRVSITKV